MPINRQDDDWDDDWIPLSPEMEDHIAKLEQVKAAYKTALTALRSAYDLAYDLGLEKGPPAIKQCMLVLNDEVGGSPYRSEVRGLIRHYESWDEDDY